MSKVTLLRKEYSAEELADVLRDVDEALDPTFKQGAEKLPEPDEHGLHSGIFRVSIVWCSEDDCDCTGFQHHSDCQHHWSKNGGEVPY